MACTDDDDIECVAHGSLADTEAREDVSEQILRGAAPGDLLDSVPSLLKISEDELLRQPVSIEQCGIACTTH
jgi:hypothetical protein